jgi:hypothetical protein
MVYYRCCSRTEALLVPDSYTLIVVFATIATSSGGAAIYNVKSLSSASMLDV